MNSKFRTGGLVMVMLFGATLSFETSWVSAEEQKQKEASGVQERAIPQAPIGAPPRGAILPSRPVAASTDVSCSNGKKFSIKTGSNVGRCDVHAVNGKVTGGQCNDGKGNDSFVSCDTGCTGTSGNGDCKDITPK